MSFQVDNDVMVAMRDEFVPMLHEASDGDDRRSLDDPEPLTPGEVDELTLDLSVTSNVFLPGHRIRLEVSSSNFPRFDRNTKTGGVTSEDSESDAQTAVNRVFHGPDRGPAGSSCRSSAADHPGL